ncbi:hypothetical protein GCM10023231_22870 [Olivibacter ginsenosidimutans]|uniref:Uncharacterized protein n=2 Tax=Olivibacter ginsenosidimutans TaxID=1176537 RepID=A0ABP9BGR7_9SPHI
MKCPLLSRDEFKEGYLNTFKCSHDDVNRTATTIIYETFFQTIELLLSQHISLVAEAAFQHHVWQPKIMSYRNIAIIRIVICDLLPELARSRYINRIAADSDCERYHGDQAELRKKAEQSLITSYIPPDIPVPTLRVNTTNQYAPDISEILDFTR